MIFTAGPPNKDLAEANPEKSGDTPTLQQSCGSGFPTYHRGAKLKGLNLALVYKA